MTVYRPCAVCEPALCRPCPAWSRAEVTPGLWVGGGLAPLYPVDGFALVVTLDPHVAADNPAPPLAQRLDLPFPDAQAPDPSLLDQASDAIGQALTAGGTVLVRCHEGLNRAGLVTAWHLTRTGTFSASDAIIAVQEARSLPGEPALYNQAFQDALLRR